MYGSGKVSDIVLASCLAVFCLNTLHNPVEHFCVHIAAYVFIDYSLHFCFES